MKKIHTFKKIVLVSLSSFIFLAGAEFSYAEINGTGLQPMTSAEWKELKKRRVKRVKQNALGIERKNEELRRQGIPEYDSREAVSPDDEVEILPEGDMSFSEDTAADVAEEILPTAVDNSVLPAFPPIRSQGSEGSCVAWATTYYQLSHETCLARNCSNPSGAPTIFAPRWTYNMINGGADNGSSLTNAFRLLARHGSPSHAELPYVAGDYRKWDLNTAHWRSAISYRSNDMVSITRLDTALGVANLKQLLANGHVLTFATYVSSYVYGKVGNNPAEPSPYAGQYAVRYVGGSSGGHVMTIVGYNDSIWIDINLNGLVDAGEKGAYKVANSWGSTWKNSGYIWVAYDALGATSKVANGPSTSARTPVFRSYTAYHLPARTSYQPKLLAEFTLNTLKRNQILILLGSSSTTATTPSSTWTPGALRSQGGAYAFNGTTTAVDATFAMDLTDLVPTGTSSLKYYVKVTDSTSGSPVVVKSFVLRDPTKLTALNYNGTLPISKDASTATLGIAYLTNQQPVARILVSDPNPLLGTTVTLDGSASYDSDGSIASYSWNFGDGSAGAGSSIVSHTYQAAGTYSATLTVTDNLGSKHTTSAVIAVKAPNQLPTAKILVSSLNITAGTTVSFDGSGSSDPDGTIASYLWDFGDGNAASGALVPHTYAAGGIYTVTLTVTDNVGGSSTASMAINVSTAAGDISPPTAPMSLLASTYKTTSSTGVVTTKVNLTWKAATDNVKVVGYKLYRNGIFFGSPAGTYYTDSTTKVGYTYTYYVVAMDAAGNTSLPSNTVKVIR